MPKMVVKKTRNYVQYFAYAISAIAGFFAAAVPFNGELAVVSNSAVILFALPAFIAVMQAIHPDKKWVLAGLAVFAICIEALSILTGFPYGFFTYGEKMGWQIASLVPWTVPFAWIPLVVGALALVQRYIAQKSLQVVVGALTLVLIDLLLDPVAVRLSFWTFDSPGFYYGVPITNFLGWILSGLIGVGALNWALKDSNISVLALKGLGAILCFWTVAAFTLSLLIPGIIGVILTIWTIQRSQK